MNPLSVITTRFVSVSDDFNRAGTNVLFISVRRHTTDMYGGVEQGDTVTVMIENRGGEFISADGDKTYRVFFDTDPEIATGDVGEVSRTVTKVIYDERNQVEMLFIENGSSTDLAKETTEPSSDADDRSASNGSKVKSNDNPRSESRVNEVDADTSRSVPASNQHPDGSLNEIAEDLIGDMEFELDENKESILSDAKRRAREQQRDPAVDPKLNDT
jgi:hypothetical protein